MGRIFEKRKHTMFARFARMSKAFNRISRDIDIAVKAGGIDPKVNSRLRIAIQNAKSVNMPKDRVEAAIKRASSKDTTGYQEVVYEGFAPHGIAVLVECATDNPTRTVANIRHHFTRYGGSLGASGSIAFMFEHKGVFKIAAEKIPNLDEFELEFIDHGLEDLVQHEKEFYVYTSFQDFGAMQKALEEKKIDVISTESQYIPTTTKELSEAEAKEVQELLDQIEEDDDVASVFHTMQ
ncbi:MAG: YebC/PmpR family DNA-binding transcriptional regulator [Ignavibacteriales bacterium]|nr:YebC/PmpR family DNA-binding transcriptional regulator [Ignavibacteriales bacterium]